MTGMFVPLCVTDPIYACVRLLSTYLSSHTLLFFSHPTFFFYSLERLGREFLTPDVYKIQKLVFSASQLHLAAAQ